MKNFIVTECLFGEFVDEMNLIFSQRQCVPLSVCWTVGFYMADENNVRVKVRVAKCVVRETVCYVRQCVLFGSVLLYFFAIEKSHSG